MRNNLNHNIADLTLQHNITRSAAVAVFVALASAVAAVADSDCGESPVFSINDGDGGGLYVTFHDGTPIAGAFVWAYRIVNGDEIERIPPRTTTDEYGYAERPEAFALYPGERLGLQAVVKYVDPGYPNPDRPDGVWSILNYPNNAPFRPRTQGLTGHEPIVVPYPVVLQAGLWSGTTAWPKFGTYLRSDPAELPTDPDPNYAYRSKQWDASRKLPAFMTFIVPSLQRDWVLWGYDNSLPFTPLQHELNISVLDDFVENRMNDALASVVPDTQRRRNLPIHMGAHSMGGIISRGWRSKHNTPPVERYVSFDGVHGGTLLAFGVAGGFAEGTMNGYNPIRFLPPLFPGWNYWRSIPTDLDNFLISSTDRVVFPDCSPLGVGATMLGSALSVFPNGHEARFIGGWERIVNTSHSGTHDCADLVYDAARFLAYGERPAGASSPGQLCDVDPEPLPSGTAGEYATELATGGLATVSEIVPLDVNTSIEVDIALLGKNATIEFLDAGSNSLIPADAEITQVDSADWIHFTVDAPPVGDSTLVLNRGLTDASTTVVIRFTNGRVLHVQPPEQLVLPLEPAIVTATFEEIDGSVIVGTGGGVDVTVTLPDQGQLALTLFDDGGHDDGAADDGVFGNAFTDTALGGRYFVTATGDTTYAGETIRRSSAGQFIVNTAPAAFASVTESAADDNADGDIDAIEFTIDVVVDVPGTYQVAAVLIDPNNGTIASEHAIFTTSDPTYAATLRFDSADIVEHGTPGPWKLTQINLIDDGQALLVDVYPDLTTQAYPLEDFAPPPAPAFLRTIPGSGPRQGRHTILLEGQNLSHVSEVRIGGRRARNLRVLSETVLELWVPPSPQSGWADIELITPWQQVLELEGYRYEQVPVTAPGIEGPVP